MAVQPWRLLRWIYIGRLTLAAGIFGGVLTVWRVTTPQTTLIATLVLLLTLAVTLASFWYTTFVVRTPGRNFLYAQVIYDTLLVTAVVHLTGGPHSDFPPLYIVVIAVGSLLLPLPGGVLIGALASILYAADIVWGHAGTLTGNVPLQIALFSLMALAAGTLGDRARRTGSELGLLESELRQLRLDTRDILGTIDTGVVTVDGEGRLEYLNRAAEGLLGLEAEEWLARPVLDELERCAPGLGSAIRRTGRSRLPIRRYQTRARPPEAAAGGDGRILGVRTTILERAGAPWVTAVFQDITDGKRLEELNRRAERLEAVAELSSSLAHEIKNPLSSIRSAVEQLAGGRVQRTQDRELLQGLVVRESDRLSRLLTEFLEFSRVEVRRQAVIDVAAVVRDAVALVEQHPELPPGLTIGVQPNGAPAKVKGDADLLHRAVFNLVLNAVQHAGEEGLVLVELTRLKEQDLPPGIRMRTPVRLVVTDNGPGIPPDIAQRIFDPFFTTRKGGTGLGLALVHRAAQAHGGAILVDGAVGGGARFTLYLPGATAEGES
jgi:two-component system, NtrC family, sensor histidine kinase PilS